MFFATVVFQCRISSFYRVVVSERIKKSFESRSIYSQRLIPQTKRICGTPAFPHVSRSYFEQYIHCATVWFVKLCTDDTSGTALPDISWLPWSSQVMKWQQISCKVEVSKSRLSQKIYNLVSPSAFLFRLLESPEHSIFMSLTYHTLARSARFALSFLMVPTKKWSLCVVFPTYYIEAIGEQAFTRQTHEIVCHFVI